MVFEIFSYLHTKHAFRSANQATYNFHSKEYSSNVKITTAGCGFFIQDHHQNDLVLLGDDDDQTSRCSYGVPEDFLSNNDSVVIGCNNGIVVYEEKLNYGDLGQLFVTNPVTLQCRTIPRPATSNGATRLLGSVTMLAEHEGSHSTVVDYNLVCFLPTGDWDNCVDYRVYSSTEGRWMEESFRKLKFERPVLVNKTIYFVSNCFPYFKTEPYIVAVDVDQESSKILPLPVPLISCDYEIEIANWGDDHGYSSLCLVRWCNSNSTFTIWIMEDKKKWTWSKSTVEIKMKSMGWKRSTEKRDVSCFTLINDKLVFNIGSDIHVYGLKDGRRRKLHNLNIQY